MNVLRRCSERLGLRRFLSDRRGNIAVIFGISIVPLAIAAGVAFDYTIAASDRTKLQHVNDEAIIAVARALQANSTMTLTQQKAIVTSYLAAEVPSLNASIVNYTVDANGVITLDTTAKVSRGLSQVIPDPSGQYVMTIGAHSVATAQAPSLEVALVLDHTGSMAESAGGMTKITALQQAANNLVNTVMANSSTKVAVVPFSMSVNVGTTYNTASWVDTTGLSSIHWQQGGGGIISKPSWAKSRFDLFAQTGVAWRGCFEVRPGSYAYTEAAPTTGTPDTLFVPIFAPDEPGDASARSITDSTRTPAGITNSYLDDGFNNPNPNNSNETQTWQYIIADNARYKNASSNVVLRGTPPNDQGPNYACDPTPMLRLTTNKSTVQSHINSLTPAGNTNILEGFMWGWRALSPNAPFADGKSYSWNINNPTQPNKKILVLMTDGYNTWSSQNNPFGSEYSAFGYYSNHRLPNAVTDTTSARNAMDAAVALACTNAKGVTDSNGNATITIYTVGFSVPVDPIDAQGLALLQNCASKDASGNPLYYYASNSTSLINAFGLIAKSINNLRLTQ